MCRVNKWTGLKEMLWGEGWGWDAGQEECGSVFSTQNILLPEFPSPPTAENKWHRNFTAEISWIILKFIWVRKSVNHQEICVSVWWLEYQIGACPGNKHGELAGVGFGAILVSFVGATYLVCVAGSHSPGLTSFIRRHSEWEKVSPVTEKWFWHL